jgi:anaerobic nitric oxide reductase transcription regulator
VRELENVLSRAVLRSSAGHADRSPLVLEPEAFELPLEGRQAGGAPATAAAKVEPDSRQPLREQLKEFQRRAIEDALEESGGNWAAAARRLGMHRSNLHHLAARLGLRGSSPRP